MGAINIHKYSAITSPDKTEVSPLMGNVNIVQYCNDELLICYTTVLLYVITVW